MGDLTKQKQRSIGRTSFVEPTYNASNQPINIIEWKTSSKLKKLFEQIITYTNGVATNLVSKTYLDDGTVVETHTVIPVYSGGIVQNFQGTLT